MLHSFLIRMAGLATLVGGFQLPAAHAETPTLAGRAVAAIALPYQPDPAVNRLFSALWSLPHSMVDGPVAELRQKGGAVQVLSDSRGMIVLAEGPAEWTEVVERAAQEFAAGHFSEKWLPRAKANVLKSGALFTQSARDRAEARLWQLFYGETTSAAELEVEDLALLRLQAADVVAFQKRLQQQKPVFFASRTVRKPAAFFPAVPSPQPGPAWVQMETERADGPRLLVGQPLPPLPALRGPAGRVWAESIEASLSDLDASVSIAFRPASALLVIDLPVRESAPEALRDRVAERLGKVGAPLPLPVPSASPNDMAAPSQADAQQLRTQAEAHLLFGRGPGEMTSRLWSAAWGLVLTPDAMRAVLLVPATPAS